MDAPRVVDVPVRSATGPRPLTGEPLALDLVNTVWRHGGLGFDLLADDAGLRQWIGEHGDEEREAALATRAGRAPRLRDRRLALVETRDAIRGVLEHRDDPAARAAVNAILARGLVHPTLAVGGPTEAVEFDDPCWVLPWRAAQSLLELLGDRPERVRPCAHDACGLFFFDVTRSGTRRWCSMETCGNRAKAQRHYARVRADVLTPQR